MSYRTGLALAVIAVSLGGCATPPQAPVALSDTAIQQKAGKVGVAMAPLPKIDTEFPGAWCLLCYAAASAANSALTSHAKTLAYEDLPALKGEVADQIRKKGVDVVLIPEEIKVKDLSDYSGSGVNIAKKDHTPLKQKYKIDKLVMINITDLGFTRSYSAYTSTSDPKGLFRATGYVVDLSSNTYEWYLPVEIAKAADKNWDEAPKFPGLTNAYFQAVELGKEKLLEPLLKK